MHVSPARDHLDDHLLNILAKFKLQQGVLVLVSQLGVGCIKWACLVFLWSFSFENSLFFLGWLVGWLGISFGRVGIWGLGK